MSRAKAQQQSISITIIRIIWLALVLPSVSLFIAALPIYFVRLQQPCVDSTTCNIPFALTAKGMKAMSMLGFSEYGYAAFVTIFWAIIFMIWSGMGLLIFLRKSDDRMALLTAFLLVMFNMGTSTLVLPLVYPALTFPIMLISLPGQIALGLFFLLFPNGRLIPRWIGLLVPLTVFQAIAFVAPPSSPFNVNSLPEWFNGLIALSVYGGIIIAQIYRYRKASNAIERQQTKWVAFGIIIVAAGFVLFGLLFGVLFPEVNRPDSPYSLLQIAYPLLLLVLPITIGFAVLRYRLWDIDLIINRTLVYGLLTAFVIGMYVLVVGYLGALLRTNGNLGISLIATGIVAVLFQPLRNLLQRSINRLLYGLRDEPYVVLAGLGQRLKATLDPDAVLATIVETVREALKLSYAAIEVKEGAAFVLAASSGPPLVKEMPQLPLIHQGEVVGTLIIAPRRRDETLTPADLRLLDDLTHQIGSAVHTIRLTSELQALTQDLKRSREHLITAREEERRRLRRDLHDGLGPMLSAIMLKVGLVRTLYQRDAKVTDKLLKQIETEIESVIDDIRRLVYNLRPPKLDELGLIDAVREYVDLLGAEEYADSVALKITVEAPEALPALPAAVEVAAYRIVQEAMTNVIRHAHAQTCCVHFLAQETLQIEICDDGKGIEEVERIRGLGLTSMRERAEELGGTLSIKKIRSGGTQVTACLPLPAVVEVDARE
ncbi:GAF domain-containing sensor histidine kinase [Dictyobacter formicarum]|uniref:Histidine kinase domain-containing protein n=1 Tax=Dictyobacter formicarum TaxID=2778368 RepID=A0ABQ3VF44_9CHLR|nr:GAF domain-containing sensor histidine kinase [Dictyobacter formicarum]GHO84764.1 hypothetical protein KSZ_27700 [Dictyobacter formicarum]